MTELLHRLRQWHLLSRALQLAMVGFTAVAYVSWRGMVSVEWWIFGGVAALCMVGWQYAEYRIGRISKAMSVQNQFQSRQAFDILYERSPVAYVLIEARGRIRLANTAAVHLLGETVDTIVGRNFYECITSDGDVSTAVIKGKIERGAIIAETEIPLHTFNEEQKWALISVFEPDDPHHRLVSLVDVTDQKAVDTAKSEFVALATHQLRTPIAAIRWNVELLGKTLRETASEKQARYMEKIDRNVNRMISLINDFLSVSKLEMGTYAAEREEINLREYFDEILQEFDEKVTQKQLKIEKRADPQDVVVRTDRRLFHIIFSNLVSNAVKYTPENGTVQITIEATGGSLRLSVIDSGIGIPEKEIPQLFTKFYRASNAQIKVSEGTGLGLYVVKQSVEILGGTITVSSKEDAGTTFVVQLPSIVVSGR